MKKIQLALAAGLVAFALPAHAQDRTAGAPQPPAAVGDTEQLIYRVTGARDNGGAANTGVATIIDCTNFSGVTETVRYVARNFNSTTTPVANATRNIAHLETRTAATHFATGIGVDLNLATGTLNQGTIAIAATTNEIVCTAYVVDASTAVPNGYALRVIRFNPAPGSQE